MKHNRLLGLEGRVALVTGATGFLGRHVAEVLAENGLSVCIAHKTSTQIGEELQRKLKSDFDADSLLLQFDLEQEKAVQKATTEAISWKSRLDAIVCCHGVADRRYLRYASQQDVSEQLGVNVAGTIFCVKSILPHMCKNRFGRIILVGSTTIAGQPQYGVYAATKSALLGLVRSCSQEYGRFGITSNVVSPGVLEGSRAASGPDREKRISAYPMRKFIDPNDIAWMFGFLISDHGKSITGQHIVVDGGES